MASTFSVTLTFKGSSVQLDDISPSTTGKDLYSRTRSEFGWTVDDEVKLLYKGKKLQSSDETIFTSVPKKSPKIIVMATMSSTVSQVANQKSDPLMRGFDQEKAAVAKKAAAESFWGLGGQDKNYKFVRLEACTWQSFGHRPSEKTPHAFEAKRLLEKLATDPGVIAVMKERELVVNTLGEMDPIDDRLMQKKQADGNSCLLGYNTNHGLRIDVKLRTEDLEGFRPYPELVATLIHELSHNWVSEHNLLFWTNFGQMRAEYFYYHVHSTVLFKGKSTAELAGLSGVVTKQNIVQAIMTELAKDMQQHGLNPTMIQQPIQQRCQELDQAYAATTAKDQRLGGEKHDEGSARSRAFEAAERRRQEQNES